MIRHLRSINDLSLDQIYFLLESAQNFSQKSTLSPPKNQFVAQLFFENSTRTHCSFEIAAKKCGYQVLNFPTKTSSLHKGESLKDTLLMLKMMGVQAAVIRHSDDLLFENLSESPLSLINAGSGKRHHPSQALLDLFTIKKCFKNLDQFRLGICGDILNSRVAHSHFDLWEKIGGKILISAPSALLPSKKKLPGHVEVCSFEELIQQSDAVMMLRVQKERHQEIDYDFSNYHQDFGLSIERIKKMKESAIILHPGPYNLGVEITQEVVDHPKSQILNQVQNGVWMRSAILNWILEKV